MPTFTDTELQKKFCEGFTFFPFKSLEQHDTLIYKRYSTRGNLKQLLAWHNSEHDAGHYRIKLAEKLKHTDLPETERLLQSLSQTDNWCRERAFARKLCTSGKKFSAFVDRYSRLLKAYREDVLHPLSSKLSDKYQSATNEFMDNMQHTMGTFVRDADELYDCLNEAAAGKQGIFQKSASDSDRENFSRLITAMQTFNSHQTRSIELLGAWKERQIMNDIYRVMN